MHLQTEKLGAPEHCWAKLKSLRYHLGKSNQAADDLSQFPLARPHQDVDVEVLAAEVYALAGGSPKNMHQVNWVEI